MKIKTSFISFILMLIIHSSTFSQVSDSTKSYIIIKQNIIPFVLIGSGLALNKSNFEKELQTNIRNKTGNNFHFPIDDYFQYVPIAELYLADIVGIKSKNHWFDQTKYLLISNIITSGITHSIKFLYTKERPNGSDLSFPSGHTSFVFTNATVLYEEFKLTSPILAYSGYAFALTTGSFRIINNNHWLSDVLVGTGLGILITKLVYYFEPFKKFNPFKNSKNINFIPKINNDSYSFYLGISF